MSEFFDAIEKNKGRIQKAILSNVIDPNLKDFFEKGKRAQVGEIRDWNGKRYQKTVNGWAPVKGEGSIGKKTSTKDSEDTYTDPSGNTLSFTEDILPKLSKIKPGVYSPESEVGRFLLDEIPDKFEKKMKNYFSEKKMTVHYNGEGAIEIKGKGGEKKKKFKSLSKEQKVEEVDKVVKALEKYRQENKADIDFLKVAHGSLSGVNETGNFSTDEKNRYHKLRNKVEGDLFDVVKEASPILFEDPTMRYAARDVSSFLLGKTKGSLMNWIRIN